MSDNFSFFPPKLCEKPYSISQINTGIATIIEATNTLVWVEGEISNAKRASSGHYYMRLKDSQSQIPAVMWRSTVIKHAFEPEDGMAITAIASIRMYRVGGYYQLEIHKMQPSGVGALYAAFETLKKKLEKQGLFDVHRKKPLPESVLTLGVITAKTGAVIRDIIRVVSQRAPHTHILLRSVPVQGDGAPTEIVSALKEMNEHGKVDCIILGRGGGSIEDLWAFNSEDVVRAIVSSHIPIIAAVGHEIDFTLTDFAADVRAATPSAAAEIAVPDDRHNMRFFNELRDRFCYIWKKYISSITRKYYDLIGDPVFRRTIVTLSDSQQHLDFLHTRSIRAMGNSFRKKQTHIAKISAQLEALSPLSVLSRGYSVVSLKGGKSIKKSDQVKVGDTVDLRFSHGDASADITSVNI